MHADDLVSIDDYSPATLQAISQRIAVSSEVEHMVYRESELDEVWRLLDADVASAGRIGLGDQALSRLLCLRQLIIEAHDLIGNDSDTAGANSRLSQAMSLA
ncbi:hypothetical protein [Pandoraea oxalativorans]|uniref:Flagellar protein FliT n=1 Tax=Pandoraea oxalativorans TaxID=573737 RepID=A0A0E3YAN0_9BURK|nr:hypothetical protein [Pandoraea oxalativorans]AKC69447.1 hypothetical protein MB84_08080 [Pandoraea oxalativorans]